MQVYSLPSLHLMQVYSLPSLHLMQVYSLPSLHLMQVYSLPSLHLMLERSISGEVGWTWTPATPSNTSGAALSGRSSRLMAASRLGHLALLTQEVSESC